MIDTSPKHLQEGENDHPDIGNFVHWFIKEQRFKKIGVAQKLQINPITLNQYFKQRSLQFGVLWRLSQAIHYNLIMDLGERLQIPFETQAEKKLKAALAEKDAELVKMQIELEVYRSLKK